MLTHLIAEDAAADLSSRSFSTVNIESGALTVMGASLHQKKLVRVVVVPGREEALAVSKDGVIVLWISRPPSLSTSGNAKTSHAPWPSHRMGNAPQSARTRGRSCRSYLAMAQPGPCSNAQRQASCDSSALRRTAGGWPSRLRVMRARAGRGCGGGGRPAGLSVDVGAGLDRGQCLQS